jgi:hypothetical protein
MAINVNTATQAQQLYPDQTSSQTSATSPQQSQTVTPQGDYSQLFQPGYLGAPATVNPTQAGAGTVDLSQLFGGWQGATNSNAQTSLSPSLTNSLGSNQTIQQLLQGFAPQAQNSTNQLNQTLADFGVGGGQAVGAQTQLQGQLAASLAPSIASAIQNSQANQLNAGEFGTSNALNQSLANSGAANTNTNALNSIFGSTLGNNANNVQNTNQFNAGSQNSADQYNASALNSTNAANVGQQNQTNQSTLNDLLNQYYAQLSAFSSINSGGQTAGNQNAVNYGQDITTQQDPFTTIFGDLAGAGAQLGSASIKAGA